MQVETGIKSFLYRVKYNNKSPDENVDTLFRAQCAGGPMAECFEGAPLSVCKVKGEMQKNAVTQTRHLGTAIYTPTSKYCGNESLEDAIKILAVFWDKFLVD